MAKKRYTERITFDDKEDAKKEKPAKPAELDHEKYPDEDFRARPDYIDPPKEKERD